MKKEKYTFESDKADVKVELTLARKYDSYRLDLFTGKKFQYKTDLDIVIGGSGNILFDLEVLKLYKQAMKIVKQELKHIPL